jgi:Ca-activated chloride channel family protein
MNANTIRLCLLSLTAATAPLAAQIDRPIPIVPRPVPPTPQVRASSLRVETRIQDGIATTELRQSIRNEGGGQAEATWILPLPEGSLADRFTMTVGGKEVASEVLDAARARQIYEEIVRRRRDPGLLEYMGHGCLRARVFPIPAQGSVDVLVRYRQVLPATAGLHAFTFPLRAAGVEGAPAERVALDVVITSRQPIKNVYSPLPGVDIVRKGDHEARVSLELGQGRTAERDLTVFYGVSDAVIGLDLLTWRKAGAPGWFLLMATPKQDWPEPKNTMRVVQFVLDTSGSMAGQKIEQARRALRFFVRSLKSGDRFNIVPFSTEARPFFPAPVEVSSETVGKATEMIDALEARGGTNIEDGLRTALAAELPKHDVPVAIVPITVFLTDGQPTVGTTDVDQLLKIVVQSNRHGARVFVFGVGNDVNTRLCDKIAEDARGDRDYVREGEDIEVKTTALFEKLGNPVLTDVELLIDGAQVSDVEPKRIADLFKGSRLMVLGRYSGHGHHAVRLRGKLDGAVREFVYEAAFPSEASAWDFVPLLWAQRKIAVLLDAIRLNGQSPELVTEVQRLGREFGIVTPFTSHLIVEEGMQVAQSRGFDGRGVYRFFSGDGDEAEALGRLTDELRRAGALAPGAEAKVRENLATADRQQEAARGRLAKLGETEVGADAVDTSVTTLALRVAGAPAPMAGGGGDAAAIASRRIAGRMFHLVGGVWVDRAFRPEMRGHERKIAAFSDEYFALLREHPELAPALAFSTQIVVVVGDVAIEIG